MENHKSLSQRIYDGEFNPKTAYPYNIPRKGRGLNEQYLKYMDEQEECDNRFQDALEEEYKTTYFYQNVKDKLFEKAWEHGHASGLSEVRYFYGEFVEIAMACLTQSER